MAAEYRQSEGWAVCPPGTLNSYAHKVRRRRQIRTAANVVGVAIVIFAFVGLTTWSVGSRRGDEEFYYGGIACREVRSNLKAFRGGSLPDELAGRIRTHLKECPTCQELVEHMQQARQGTALLNRGDHGESIVQFAADRPASHVTAMQATGPSFLPLSLVQSR